MSLTQSKPKHSLPLRGAVEMRASEKNTAGTTRQTCKPAEFEEEQTKLMKQDANEVLFKEEAASAAQKLKMPSSHLPYHH